MKKACLSALLLLLVCACSTIDCPVQNTVRTYYGLYKADQTTDTLKAVMSIYSFRRDGDSLVLNQGESLTAFSLPIGYSNPEDTLYFEFTLDTETITDTVWIKKENIPHFESVDCSAAFFHRLTAVRCTHGYIDSIGINNSLVDYDANTEHLKLYLRQSR